ncbi:MAG: hypothetical protein ABEJ65_07420, partial [bacterium]
PMSSFYLQSQPEDTYLRFAFCKDRNMLERAADNCNPFNDQPQCYRSLLTKVAFKSVFPLPDVV